MKTKKAISKIIDTNGVGILPTDTLYGLVGSALSKKAVAKIVALKKRSPNKPFIILISSRADLAKFGIKMSPFAAQSAAKVWPGPVSIVLPCSLAKFSYLHLATKTLAFRQPKNKWLQELLKQTGPLVAPSANPEGLPPAETITEAKQYFGEKVDFYLSAKKRLKGHPSTLIKIEENGKIKILRKGKKKLWKQ